MTNILDRGMPYRIDGFEEEVLCFQVEDGEGAMQTSEVMRD